MERYRLSELVQLSGVTPRTIRFYIAEGLLPPPEGNGPAAVYTAEHRDRLRLIGLLKDRYLPLKEIRRQLATLTAEEVRERLGQGEGGGGVALPGAAAAGVGAPKPDAALNYLDRVLGQAAAARGVREHQPVGNPPPVAAPPPPFPPATSPRRPQPGNAPSAAPRARGGSGSSWPTAWSCTSARTGGARPARWRRWSGRRASCSARSRRASGAGSGGDVPAAPRRRRHCLHRRRRPNQRARHNRRPPRQHLTE